MDITILETSALSMTDFMAICIACIMMVLDIISGFMGAVERKDIQSSRMREGLFHKGTMLILIIIAWIMQFFVHYAPEITLSMPSVLVVCLLIISMELVSIIENLAEINPELKGSKLLELFEGHGESKNA